MTEIENKISDTSGLVKRTDYNTKITEVEGKKPRICGLATNASLETIKPDLKNKIPNISTLFKKQIITQKLLKLKTKLQIIVMTNILLLQSLISLDQKIFLNIKAGKFCNKYRFS